MNTGEITAEQFEKDSLEKFERILQSYRRAKESSHLAIDMEKTIEMLLDFPTDELSISMMKLFDFEYLVKGISIDKLIAKALCYEKEILATPRSIKVKLSFYKFPFVGKEKYLKRYETFNHKDECCYLIKGVFRVSLSKGVYYYQNNTVFKELEIHKYSKYLSDSQNTSDCFYSFFMDYHSKVLFVKYFSNLKKEEGRISSNATKNILTEVLQMTNAQQVLWSYFFFRGIGLKLRLNLEGAMLTRFVHAINQMELKNYRNSYVHKLVMKAPYVKSDKNLVTDLLLIKSHFQKCGFSTLEIENEIHKIGK
ncbi:MAG: hypothetical protein ABF244_05560 [Flavobacteriaceae bacterium]